MAIQTLPLLTCPFCGTEPRFIYRGQFKEWFVSCPDENCACKVGWTPKGQFAAMSQQEAARRWNQNVERRLVQSPMVKIS